MKTKQEYQEQMEVQLTNLQTKIDELRVKAALAKADARDAYYEQIEALNPKYETARIKLQELKLSSGNAWEDIKAGMESAWDELQNAFSRAADRFH
jgi:hypothetical protein